MAQQVAQPDPAGAELKEAATEPLEVHYAAMEYFA